MIPSLGKSLSSLLRRIITACRVDREEVESFVKELQKILLQADVSVELVKRISDSIRDKCLREKLPPGLTLRERLVKVLYEELVELLGKEPASLVGKKRIMLVGLYGVGKTTVAGKLARYFQKQGLRPALVACDYHRPAAPEQLEQLAREVGVPVHRDKDKDPYRAARDAIKKFEKFDVLIFDTAGRDALDEKLAEELRKLGKIVMPDEVLLVIPADIGKVGGRQAEEFDKLVGITGVVITRMDGTAKGGGAIAACASTGAKVKFIGTGEKLEDFSVYDPIRFVSRLLGMGDLQTLLEKVKEVEIKEGYVEKIVEGKFTLQDLYYQIENIGKMGSLSTLMEMIPGLGYSLPENLVDAQEKRIKKWKAIIQSMTPEERMNPEIINSSRIRRIALGSGTKESEVRELLKHYDQIKRIMKKLGGMKGLKRGALLKLARKLGLKI